MNKPLLLLAGPSGSGKTTIAKFLEREYWLKQLNSLTTRKPRYENESGHTFISKNEFIDYMAAGSLVAFTEINGNLYGATQAMVDDADIYVIDPRGAQELLAKYTTNRVIFYVFIDAPNEHERRQRMIIRGGNDAEYSQRANEDLKIISDNAVTATLFDHHCSLCNDSTVEEIGHKIANFVGWECSSLK